MVRQAFNWRVEVGAEVEPFEEAWRALTGSAHATPFQSYDLMRAFYSQLAVNRSAEPVIALVRDADGRPVALFPMMRSRRYGLNWLHTDARPLDYCAPILDRSLSPAAVRSVVKAMLAAVPRADLLYCNRIPQSVDGLENPLLALPNAARLRLSSWALRLEGRSAEEVVKAQRRVSRSALRLRIKRMGEAYRRSFRIAFADEITPEDFEMFRALRAESLPEKGRSDILGDPEWSGLYDVLIRDGGACRAWFATLKADDVVVAALFGFVLDKRVQAVLTVSRMNEWRYYSPGLQLVQEVYLYFHGNGAAMYDFSIGDMLYKRRFGCDETALHDAVFPKTLLGHAFYAFWRLKVKIRAKLKPIAEAG